MKSVFYAKKFLLFSLILIMVSMCLYSCNEPSAPSGAVQDQQITAGEYTFVLSSFDKGDSWESNSPNIIFDGMNVSTTSENVQIQGTDVVIKKAGTYVVSGILTDGQIIVEASQTDKVHLVFSGVTMTSKDSSCVWIKSADKVCLTLAENTTNKFTDAARYTNLNASDEPTACIFSKCDLTINGKGTMIVTGLYNNGIATKDDLKIMDGTIVVSAQNNAIKGKDSLVVMGGNISVTESDDAIKVSNDLDADKGYLYIGGGNLSLIAYDDALQSTNAFFLKGGKVEYNCGGKSVNCDNTVEYDEALLTEAH